MKLKEMTKEELIDYIKNLQENESGKYGLVWDKEKEPEKIVTECDKKIPILTEIKDKNIDNEGQENILIEGDNFHSLSVLNYTHNESIDVIYIDPPYNTGNKDFIYNDKFVDLEDGYRHSKWLNFMQKRLKLAKKLLKETGVIFLSIDDNEFAQLRLLCDQIFGEKNYISTFAVIKAEGGGLAKQVVKGHDYVLIYSKNIDKFTPLARKKNIRGKIINKDGIEYWVQEDWLRKEFGRYGNCYYEEILKYKDQKTKDEIDNGLQTGKYILIPKSNGMNIVGKLRKLDEDSSKFYSVLKHLNKNGIAELRKINENNKFNYPKPVSLIKELISGATFFSRNNHPIILDFFAGSGTTAQAVLELNNEDNGNRQFILCTNNENNICEEVTYPRCSTIILGKRVDHSVYSNGLKGSLKYFKTDFVDNIGTRDQLYYDLTEKCIPMLCVKGNTFDKVESNNEFSIFTNHDKSKYSCVYFDIFGLKYNEFLNKIKSIKEEKLLYIFTLGNYINTNSLKDISNYTVEPIPYKIVELYKKIVKMSKED